MARSRNIKPGFFSNDVLAEVPALGRLLFAGLWTIADRAGRLEDRPKRIKAEILPYDECNADDLLQQLADRGFLIRYEVAGTRYIQIVNWDKHQNPHVKETPSTIPDRDGNLDSTEQASIQNSSSTVQEQLEDDSPPERAGLIPDSLIPRKDIRPNFGGKGRKVKAIDGEPPGFAEWYAAYPRHEARADAAKAFGQLDPDSELQARMLAAVAARKQTEDWRKEGGRFVPLPASWIRGKRWEDAIGPPIGVGNKPWVTAGYAARDEWEADGRPSKRPEMAD